MTRCHFAIRMVRVFLVATFEAFVRRKPKANPDSGWRDREPVDPV